jgi:hypothetical protein
LKIIRTNDIHIFYFTKSRNYIYGENEWCKIKSKSLYSYFFEFFNFLLFLKWWYTLSLQPFLHFLAKSLYSSIQQIQIIITFLMQLIYILNSFFFIEMINYYNFSFLILICIQLRQYFVSFDVSSWKIKSLSNMILFVFFRLTQIN